MTADLPWRQRSALHGLVSVWRDRFVGRTIAHSAAGKGWCVFTLSGRPSPRLFFIARPGAALLWDATEKLDPDILAALGSPRRSDLAALTGRCRLSAVGLYPEDRIFTLSLDSPRHGPLCWSCQLFGPRGNLVLLDGEARLLWALYRPLHAALTRLPGNESFAPSDAPTCPDQTAIDAKFRGAALESLRRLLETEQHTVLAGRCRRAEQTCRRLVANLKRDLAEAKRGDEHRRAAETLAIHLPEVPRGAAEVRLSDPVTGVELRIPLNPALGPVANMEYYFRLARKADRGRAIIAKRLTAAESRLSRLEAGRAELDGLGSKPTGRLRGLLDWRRRNAELLADVQGSPAEPRARPGAPEPDRPFRRYWIENAWEVWIGRSNQENDKLTHQAAAPNDLWFHAQGVPGSHVILRTGGRPELVPKRVLEKAAALAAMHSKARHSSLAPVIYTRRKYVRKPRKSLPGTAACIREKTLFVEPGTPPATEPI